MKKECLASDIALWGFQMMHDYVSYNPLLILSAEVGGFTVVSPALREAAEQERPGYFSCQKDGPCKQKKVNEQINLNFANVLLYFVTVVRSYK